MLQVKSCKSRTPATPRDWTVRREEKDLRGRNAFFEKSEKVEKLKIVELCARE